MHDLFLRQIMPVVLTSGMLSCLLVPLMIIIARSRNILDAPDGKIKMHKTPTPYLGGVAVFLATLITHLIFVPTSVPLIWFYTGLAIIFGVGLLDDLFVASPGQKFLGQFIGVLFIIKGGFYLKYDFFSDIVNMGLTTFWMLSVINAFNLVDVMDGLSSTLALCASIGFLCVAGYAHQFMAVVCIVIFIAAVALFLLYNKPTARIYLGDAGSLFLGAFLAAIPVLLSWSEYQIWGHLAPSSFLALPLLEITMLVIIRTSIKIPFYRGSPHHFALFLQHKGWSRWQVLGLAVLFSALFGGVGMIFYVGIIDIMVYVALNIGISLWWLWLVYR